MSFHDNSVKADWIKNETNPILSRTKQNSWFINHILNPFVIYDNGYQLWFTGDVRIGGNWNIGYASSTNGISNWSIIPNPVISASQSEEKDVNLVSIIKNGLEFNLWYNTTIKYPWALGVDRFRIGYATSSSIDSWNKQGLVIKGEHEWELGGLDRGFSINKHNGLYHLWYAATDTENLATNPHWKIGYATSPNGITWTKHPGNPVITQTEPWEYQNMMYPNVLYEDGKFKMWYGTGSGDHCTRYAYAESTNGYEWTKPADKNPVYQITGVASDFDGYRLGGHTRIREGDVYKIWYSGYNGSYWSIGYATSSAEPAAPPSEAPDPILIIPGMMSSWNKEGILEGKEHPTTPWRILPFVSEYDGLMSTLKQLGYEEGKTLFLWPYDWRRPISELTAALDGFIRTVVKPTNPDATIQLVGHSLGGLIARSWAQKTANSPQISHLVTVGTPHEGVVQAYPAWSGGTIAEDLNWFTFATKIALELNRRAYATDRETIQRLVPILRDLLPTEPYLMRQSDATIIPIAGMNLKNPWLSQLNVLAPAIQDIHTTLRGSGLLSPDTLTVKPPNWLDKQLGNWIDGKPVAVNRGNGDGVIPMSRADVSSTTIDISGSHGEIIAHKEGISRILTALEIPVQDGQITESRETKLKPGLLLFLRSPATLQVQHNGITFTDTDGILFIPDAQNGMYDIRVVGTGTGTYRLAIGQFTQTTNAWNEYIGSTSPGQQTLYRIQFNGQLPDPDPVKNLSDKERLREIELELQELATRTRHTGVVKARSDLQSTYISLMKEDYLSLKKQLEQILMDLSLTRRAKPILSVRMRTFTISERVIRAYQAILSKKSYVIDQDTLLRLDQLCQKEESRIGKLLEKKTVKKNPAPLDIQTYAEAVAYRESALTASDKTARYGYLYLSQLLFRETGL